MSEIHTKIDNLIKSNKVILFMKGNKQMPQCGFSARTIEALFSIGIDFETVDVLSDPEIRQGIKDYSNWPTIPQLYINEEFIGGCDIVTQMVAAGELHEVLGIEYVPPKAPELHLSDAFVTAIQGAIDGAGGQGLTRLQISPRFEYGIGLSEEAPGDFKVEANGLTVLVDASTAERADGIRLDFRDGAGGGIVIDNPNEPPSVRGLDVHSYKSMRDLNEPHHLLDVRTKEEWDKARIDGATLLDDDGIRKLDDLDKNSIVVVMCHHGIRSGQAAGELLQRGFRKVYNLEGGIDAWSIHVDTDVPRY